MNVSTSGWALIALAVLLLLSVFKGCNVNNTCITKENKIKASDEALTATLSSKDNVLAGKSQAAMQYSRLVLAAIDTVMSKRYGDGGSKAVMQFISEQNPTIEPAAFLEIQQSLDILFANIETSNRQLIDDVRNYKNFYQSFPNSLFAGILGFPAIDIAHYEKAIVTKSAREESDSRESKEVKLFQ